jgi:hypothetical protein
MTYSRRSPPPFPVEPPVIRRSAPPSTQVVTQVDAQVDQAVVTTIFDLKTQSSVCEATSEDSTPDNQVAVESSEDVGVAEISAEVDASAASAEDSLPSKPQAVSSARNSKRKG